MLKKWINSVVKETAKSLTVHEPHQPVLTITWQCPPYSEISEEHLKKQRKTIFEYRNTFRRHMPLFVKNTGDASAYNIRFEPFGRDWGRILFPEVILALTPNEQMPVQGTLQIVFPERLSISEYVKLSAEKKERRQVADLHCFPRLEGVDTVDNPHIFDEDIENYFLYRYENECTRSPLPEFLEDDITVNYKNINGQKFITTATLHYSPWIGYGLATKNAYLKN